MPYIRIDGEEIPHVRFVSTMNDGKTFVICFIENAKDATALHDFLTKLKDEKSKHNFDVLSDKGQSASFEGMVVLARSKERGNDRSIEVNFNIEPTDHVSIK